MFADLNGKRAHEAPILFGGSALFRLGVASGYFPRLR